MAPAVCAECARILQGTYFAAGPRHLCSVCGERLKAGQLPEPFSPDRFFRTLGFGAAGLLASLGINWAIASQVDWHPGFNAMIGAVLVGFAVRLGSRGRGSRLNQVLAVLLGYLAVGAGIIPIIYYRDNGLTFERAVYPFWAIFAAPFQGGRAGTQGLAFVFIVFVLLFGSWRMNRPAPFVLRGPIPMDLPPPPPGAGV